MKLLEDKIIFLTGGSKGIGFTCAKSYKQAGAKVMIMSNDLPSLEQAMIELGNDHCNAFGDVSVSSDVESAVQKVLSRYGRIDVIHNNAGIAQPSSPLHETTNEEWQTLFDINLKAILLTTRYGIEPLKKSAGCIINTSSIVGEIGQHNHAAYAASKGAVNTLTKAMALDYASYGIRVNAVAPAGVWTPMLHEWGRQLNDKEQLEKYMKEIHPLGYCPEADVVADVCVFLASDKARFITGSIIPVSGGAELGYRRS